MRHLSILLAGLLLLPMLLKAQSGSFKIEGKIVDASTKEIINFAEILLFEAEKGEQPIKQTLPDGEGAFIFDALPGGDYSVIVRLMGYDLLSKQGIGLAPSAPNANLGTLAMQPLEVGLAEVSVVASKRQIVYKLDKKIIDSSANLMGGGGTAVDILENTPSIRVDAEGAVSFRGSSGFIVYVDGKPSVFSGSQALEQIPAGQIENIEIITTPSARYNTDGDVGMINIVTKKNATEGLSGMVNANGNTYGGYGVDFLLNHQSGKHRWFVGGNAYSKVYRSEFEQEKTTIVDDLVTTSFSKGPREGKVESFFGKAGWEYTLPKGNLGAEVESGYISFPRSGDLAYTETRVTNDGTEPETFNYNSIDNYGRDETYVQGTLTFDHKFNDKGHELSALAYFRYDGDALEQFSSGLFNDKGERQQGHHAYEDEFRNFWRANIDYVFPYREGGRIEAGYQYRSHFEDGDYRMDYWNPETQQFFDRADIYNTFFFKEEINSIYAVVAESWQNLQAQVGVRGENTRTTLRSSRPGADRLKSRFEFFPSAHLGYSLPNEQVLMFAFSRRTTRPALFYMEPYITFRDYYTASIGNPDIRPEYINSFELNYKKDFAQNSISATAFHRSRTDKIERLRIPYEAGVTLDSMMNVGNDYSTGVELSASIILNSWWNTTLNGNVYHYMLKNEHYAGGKEASSTNFDVRWNNVFHISPTTRLQVDGNFVGPSVTTQGQTDSYWYVNLALRQQFLSRRLSATLAMRDVLASARYNNTLQTADLKSHTWIRPKYPQITLSLSYTFNSYRDTNGKKDGNGSEMFEGSGH